VPFVVEHEPRAPARVRACEKRRPDQAAGAILHLVHETSRSCRRPVNRYAAAPAARVKKHPARPTAIAVELRQESPRIATHAVALLSSRRQRAQWGQRLARLFDPMGLTSRRPRPSPRRRSRMNLEDSAPAPAARSVQRTPPRNSLRTEFIPRAGCSHSTGRRPW